MVEECDSRWDSVQPIGTKAATHQRLHDEPIRLQPVRRSKQRYWLPRKPAKEHGTEQWPLRLPLTAWTSAHADESADAGGRHEPDGAAEQLLEDQAVRHAVFGHVRTHGTKHEHVQQQNASKGLF